MNWLISFFLPPGIYLSPAFTAFWPAGLIVLIAMSGLATAIFKSIRYEHPTAWWALLPVALTHLAIFLGGLGIWICALSEILAIGWTMWATREDWQVSCLLGFFCLTYAFVPFFLGMRFASI